MEVNLFSGLYNQRRIHGYTRKLRTPIDTQFDSHKVHYVNRAVHALWIRQEALCDRISVTFDLR